MDVDFHGLVPLIACVAFDRTAFLNFKFWFKFSATPGAFSFIILPRIGASDFMAVGAVNV
jgi:hypothetical protein